MRTADPGGIHHRTAVIQIDPAQQVFDLVFVDPPYRLKLIPQVLQRLSEGDYLTPDGRVVCESFTGMGDLERLVIEREGNGFVVKSFEHVIREVQQQVKKLIRKPFTVDDFIAEKRAEAERE